MARSSPAPRFRPTATRGCGTVRSAPTRSIESVSRRQQRPSTRGLRSSIEAHRPMIESALAQVAAGETPPHEQMPPARYTLDGSLEQPDDEPWPNFQVDGYGMWLWALAEHTDGRPVQRWSKTVELVARYCECDLAAEVVQLLGGVRRRRARIHARRPRRGARRSRPVARRTPLGPTRRIACERRCSTAS